MSWGTEGGLEQDLELHKWPEEAGGRMFMPTCPAWLRVGDAALFTNLSCMAASCRMREAQAATQQAAAAPLPEQPQQPAAQPAVQPTTSPPQQQQQPASKKQKSGATGAAPPAAWKAGVGYGHRRADRPACLPACLCG